MSSRQLIDRSADLTRLRNEGYEIQIHPSNHLLVKNVPYVKSDQTVAYGTFIAVLVLNGENGTAAPKDHTIYFKGEFPCNSLGAPLEHLRNTSQSLPLGDGLVADHRFSAKPTEGTDPDYYFLITRYVEDVWKYAQRIDRSASPLTHRTFDPDDEASVFAYRDTASSRAGIMAVTEKLRANAIAIVGLGGTGSYVLDLVAKTPVREIHLFDGDRFVQHNAFRAPGAASLEDVSRIPPWYKVDYLKEKYSVFHLHIVPHSQYVDETNVAELTTANFVFLCIDAPKAKRLIVDALCAAERPFIDVGMGITLEETSLGGLVRTTFSAEEKRDHEIGVSFADVDDEYATNIQIADLNALNASLAVIRWKKHLGFYRGRNPEFSSLYTIDWNGLDNQDRLEA